MSTNLTNLTNLTNPNDILLDKASQLTSGSFFYDNAYFWGFTVAIFLIVYFLLGLSPFNIRKSLRMLMALTIPILFDLLISFGEFTFIFPLGYTFTITRGVMFITMLDRIMSYSIFSFYSSPITSPFILIASETTDSIFVFIFGLLNAGIDSIADFIFFAALFYYLISFIESKLGFQINYQVAISIALAGIPTILYSLFISNPFHEIKEVIQTTNGMLNFFASGDIVNILFILILFLINFMLISSIIFIVIELIVNLYMKVNYNKRDIEFTYDFAGMAGAYAFAYSILFFLHSDYKWFIVLPGIAILQILRSSTTNVINTHKQNMADEGRIAKVIDNYRNDKENPVIHDEFSSFNIIVALLILAGVLIIYYFLLA